MRRTPTKGQRWRVSVYPPGVDANVPTDYPLIHKASREQATAQGHYDRYAAQVGGGKIGRVIMHQGKLYVGSSQYIHLDTRWGLTAARDGGEAAFVRHAETCHECSHSPHGPCDKGWRIINRSNNGGEA